MNMILNNANNSTETKLSSTIQINETENQWKQDEIETQYISKTFYITANADIKKYKISIEEENGKSIEGIKVTDMQNKETNEFEEQQKFKVLIPIKNMTEVGYFKLKVEGQVQTKPVLYGIAPSSEYQDYALTTATYEDGIGEKSDEYPENETKIIIIKEDSETGEVLENTEFELLDEEKRVVYSDLKTDSNGKIEINHLVPGKYYLRETKAKEGYEEYKELIELQVSLHEQYTVKVKNNKEEKPEIQVEQKEKSKEVSQLKKLPVTGM